MTTADPSAGTARRPRLRLLLLLPLGLFLVLALVFYERLQAGGDPGAVPSVLIGKPAPEFTLPPLDGLGVPGLARADLAGRVTLVNVFASWCVPCRAEHPVLTALAQNPRVRIVGINFKDDPGNARRFLDELGNPYAAIGVDPRGRAAIDWGVYGVPETFIVGPDGIIREKIIGPVTPEAVVRTILPGVAKLLTPG